jgi:hypothetical protein
VARRDRQVLNGVVVLDVDLPRASPSRAPCSIPSDRERPRPPSRCPCRATARRRARRSGRCRRPAGRSRAGGGGGPRARPPALGRRRLDVQRATCDADEELGQGGQIGPPARSSSGWSKSQRHAVHAALGRNHAPTSVSRRRRSITPQRNRPERRGATRCQPPARRAQRGGHRSGGTRAERAELAHPWAAGGRSTRISVGRSVDRHLEYRGTTRLRRATASGSPTTVEDPGSGGVEAGGGDGRAPGWRQVCRAAPSPDVRCLTSLAAPAPFR